MRFSRNNRLYVVSDGTTQFGKTIMKNPEKFFTEEVMAQLEESAGKEFKYAIKLIENACSPFYLDMIKHVDQMMTVGILNILSVNH